MPRVARLRSSHGQLDLAVSNRRREITDDEVCRLERKTLLSARVVSFTWGPGDEGM